MECTLEVLTAAEAPLSYEIKTIRPDHEDDDYKDILSSIKRNRVAIKVGSSRSRVATDFESQ